MLSLKEILFYKRALPSLKFSDTPSADIVPERLIEGLPAFLDQHESSVPIPKTLLIPAFDKTTWTTPQTITFLFRLKKLKEAGFSIKYCKSDVLVDYNPRLIDDMITNLPRAPIEHPLMHWASVLNIPADEILICGDTTIQLLIEGDDSEWFSPVKHIKLNEHPLGQKEFDALLREHADHIESLEIVACPNIALIAPVSLPKLRSLHLDFRTIYAGNISMSSPITLIEVQKILRETTSLDSLILKNVSGFDDVDFDSLKLVNLEQVDLKYSAISTQALVNLIRNAPKLKKLTLSGCDDIGDALPLRDLEELNLSSSTISTQALVNLIGNAPKLKKLTLLGCGDIGDAPPLSNLEELYLYECNISPASLEKLIRHSPKLQHRNALILQVQEQQKTRSLPKVQPVFSGASAAATQAPKPNAPEAAAITVDACTREQRRILSFEQIFIGYPMLDVRMVRNKCFNKFQGNPSVIDEDPFLLSYEVGYQKLLPVNAMRENPGLFKEFESNKLHRCFGRVPITLNGTPQRLPSPSSQAVLTHYACASEVDITIERSEQDGFYYAKTTAREATAVHLELLYNNPSPDLTYNHLPHSIQSIIDDCRGFRGVSLDITPDSTPEDYLQAIISQRTGSCRHRALAFFWRMKRECPDYPVQIIYSDCHAFVEVYYRNQWISIDLGGHDAALHLQTNLLPEAKHFITPDPYPFEHLEQLFEYTFSGRGEPAPADFFRRAQNLITLHLKFMDGKQLNAWRPPPRLEKLSITSCSFTAAELNQLFARCPALKTISLTHCSMPAGEFEKINLASLPHLEHVTLTGSFVESAHALQLIRSSANRKTRFLVDNHLLIDTGVLDAHSAETTTPAYESPMLTMQSLTRRLPKGRYFVERSSRSSWQDWLSSPWRTGLIDTKNPEALLIALQKIAKDIQKPCYVISSPEALRCAAPYIQKEGDTGVIKKGPGGPLYAFLKRHEGNEHVLLINFNNFSAGDIARYNTILDKQQEKKPGQAVDEAIMGPNVDGIPLPQTCKIIGLTDTSNPTAYRGADFLSRFEHREDYPEGIEPLQPAFMQQQTTTTAAEAAVGTKAAPCTIELYGGRRWEALLVGSWQLLGHKLIWKDGVFVRAIKLGTTQFYFNNPPSPHDKEFTHFLTNLALHRAVFYKGDELIALPDGFSLDFTQQLDFKECAAHLGLNHHDAQPGYPLNQSTLADFIGKYQPDSKHGLMLMDGLIKSHQDNLLPICVTESLSELNWLTLLDLAKQHNVMLMLTTAPGITLPASLHLRSEDVRRVCFPETQHTRLFVDKNPLVYPKDALVIDVSELDGRGLLSSLHGEFNEEVCTFLFEERLGFLEQALEKGQTLVLKGLFSELLASQLHRLLFERLTNPSSQGVLWVVVDAAKHFSFMAPSPGILRAPQALPPTESVPYEARYETVLKTLTRFPMVNLLGETGVGKTHFMTQTWATRHPHVHYGEDAILSWLTDSRPGIKTLFIDEANLSSEKWSFLEGLFEATPAVFYNGQYYPLSSEHKVVLAGNPLSYGGERDALPLLLHHPINIEFKPLPFSLLKELLTSVPDATARAILSVADGVDFITPREYLMIGALTAAAIHNHPNHSPEAWGRYFAYAIIHSHLPKDHNGPFTRLIKHPSPLKMPERIGELIVNESNQEAISALLRHLELRQLRKERNACIPAVGGLGGLILEGDSGIGKSTLIMACLHARNLKKGTDYEYIPVSLSRKEKEARLLVAFHEGKIAVVDEINSSPMLERLLNALLEGKDLQGNAATNPGFMMIGSQNPIQYAGRMRTTKPLQHRLHTVRMPDLTEADVLKTLVGYGIPLRIAKDMRDEFKARQLENKTLCVRDLINVAKKWPGSYRSVVSAVTPIPQVGQVCKLTAIAAVEGYYAKQKNYEPMPLNARGTGKVSIRRLSKNAGSVQGEILEWERWRNTLEKLGFETESVVFNHDIHRFLDAILAALHHNHLPLIAFAVDIETGQPTPEPLEPSKQEHAAVITGYNAEKDELTLVHWGMTHHVDLVTLFNSNLSLLSTREQEFYKRNPHYCPEKKDAIAKYLPAQTAASDDRQSVIPAPDTGFKGKLLIVKEPVTTKLLLKRQRQNEETGLFCQHGSGFFSQQTTPPKEEGSVIFMVDNR